MCCFLFSVFLFKQKTGYDMRISDWSSDVGSSDLDGVDLVLAVGELAGEIVRGAIGTAVGRQAMGAVVRRCIGMDRDEQVGGLLVGEGDPAAERDIRVVVAGQMHLDVAAPLKLVADRLAERDGKGFA